MKAYIITLPALLAFAVSAQEPEPTRQEQATALRTRIPWRNKSADDCPDGPRYKAIGNSMAVPVMAWIGKKINERKTQ